MSVIDFFDLKVFIIWGVQDNRLALRIWRDSADTDFLPLIDMSYGSVILSEGYSELSLMLPSENVYGQGAGALSFNNKNGAKSNK